MVKVTKMTREQLKEMKSNRPKGGAVTNRKILFGCSCC